jgi:hypothetical protein
MLNKTVLTLFLACVYSNSYADCNSNYIAPVYQRGGEHEIGLIKAGLVTNPSSTSLYAYVDEAIAMRNGLWECQSKTLLFDAVAKRKGVPDGKILYSLALNESKKNGHPYPWTINAYGKGYFFKSREDAYFAAKWLVDHNYTLFDIGIMQVNWKYHNQRFDSLWDAFQPSTNIEVASDILLENYRSTNDWAKSIKWYHNRTSTERGKVYFSKFIKHFELISREKVGG